MRNTKNAAGRQFRFASLDQLLADLDRIEATDEAGTLRTKALGQQRGGILSL